MGEALMKKIESGDAKADVRKNQKAIAEFMQEFKAKMSAMLQLVQGGSTSCGTQCLRPSVSWAKLTLSCRFPAFSLTFRLNLGPDLETNRICNKHRWYWKSLALG
jgi:hypothetical protein